MIVTDTFEYAWRRQGVVIQPDPSWLTLSQHLDEEGPENVGDDLCLTAMAAYLDQRDVGARRQSSRRLSDSCDVCARPPRELVGVGIIVV